MTRAAPPAPRSPDELGLDRAFVGELVLKTLYAAGSRSGDELSETTCLPFWALDDLLLSFQKRRLVEVAGTDGPGRRTYRFELTGQGRERARDLISVAPYIGPAPVPLELYVKWVRRESIRSRTLSPADVQEGLSHLVLSDSALSRLGPAIASGRPLLLYGQAGNGKTAISEAVVDIYGGWIHVPHAVEVEGQILQIFDPALHRRVEVQGAEPGGGGDSDLRGRTTENPADANLDPAADSGNGTSSLLRPEADYDPRFVRVQRPMVMLGGELTLDQLEFSYDSRRGVHRAPPQIKANGGVLVIDDFGRQRAQPWELLNRWMIPLERNVDYLALDGGVKVEIPFDPMIVFATNLNPSDLTEEAFLRRIRYKVHVRSPGRAEYTRILERECERRGVPFVPEAVDRIYEHYYANGRSAPRACHPGDLMAEVVDRAAFFGEEARITPDLLDAVCEAYFLDDSVVDETPVPTRAG